MTSQSKDRRKFSRIPFNTWVYLQQGDQQSRALLLDISLKGILIEQTDKWEYDPAHPIRAHIPLTEESSIEMSVAPLHEHGQQLGLTCTGIDVDSISHLRRLIELNLGNPEAAERELSELLEPLQTLGD